jgi:hypothetical protein
MQLVCIGGSVVLRTVPRVRCVGHRSNPERINATLKHTIDADVLPLNQRVQHCIFWSAEAMPHRIREALVEKS